MKTLLIGIFFILLSILYVFITIWRFKTGYNVHGMIDAGFTIIFMIFGINSIKKYKLEK